MDNHIQLQGVSFSYRTGKSFFSKKSKKVLDNISLEIRQGETLGLIGRNGSGKSTLLRLLSNIVSPDEGKVIRNCKKVNLLSIELGFSEQLDGRSNIILSGLFNGFSKKDILAKMDSIVEMCGIGEALQNPLISYSSGMRARLGFSIAYHLEPDILLIDEILGVGDIDFQIKSENLIKDKMNSDQTVVLVTHDPDLVKSVCDRTIWIEDGRVKMQGASEDVIHEYLKYMLPEEAYLLGLEI
jgi:lipopolysaccharide transport system ATP-binding protein